MGLTFQDVAPLLHKIVRANNRRLMQRFGLGEAEASLIRRRLGEAAQVARVLPAVESRPERVWLQLLAADAAVTRALIERRITADTIKRARCCERVPELRVRRDDLIGAVRAAQEMNPPRFRPLYWKCLDELTVR